MGVVGIGVILATGFIALLGFASTKDDTESNSTKIRAANFGEDCKMR